MVVRGHLAHHVGPQTTAGARQGFDHARLLPVKNTKASIEIQEDKLCDCPEPATYRIHTIFASDLV